MRRRLDRTTPALLLTLLAFVAFGMLRVAAPVSALGVVFHEPHGFAVVAAVTSLAGAVLLLVRPAELAVSQWLAGPSRVPSDSELERLGRMLERVGGRAGIDPGKLILRAQDDGGINAGAGAGHLMFVTSGALRLPDDQLEAILAHELGHHRGLHPVAAIVVWWPEPAWSRVGRRLRLPSPCGRGDRSPPRGGRAAARRTGARPARDLASHGDVALLRRESALEAGRPPVGVLSRRRRRRWGYGGRLAEALEAAAGQEDEVTTRIARLMADHPPVGERVLRLRGAQAWA